MNKIKVFFYLLIIVFFLIAFFPYITYFSKTVTINNVVYFKEDGTGRNLVSDNNGNVYVGQWKDGWKNGNVYEVRNTNYYLFYRSAEILSQLKAGMKLKIYGYGIRLPFFNVYPKIIGIKPYR